MKKLNLPALGLLAGLSAYSPEAEGSPVKAPDLVEGKNVYTVPEDFIPPQIGKEGLKEIEAAVDKFRYDYYVVLVQKVEKNPSVNDDKLMDQAIDGIAADWKRDYPEQFEPTDSLFVLSYEPRKFRFLAGKQWREDFGFKKDAYDEFNDLFKQNAKNDPTRGIIKMGVAVDKFLVTKVDSIHEAEEAEARAKIQREERLKAQIKAQKEAKAVAEREAFLDRTDPVRIEARLKKEKQEAMHRDETRKITLLAKDERNKRRHIDEISHAREEKVRQEREAAEKVQQERIEAAQKAIFWKRIKLLLGTLLALTTLGVPLFLSLRRKKAYETLSNAFNQRWGAFDEKMKNALAHFTALENERVEIDLMSHLLKGKTLALYNEVTTEVDQIIQLMEAMRKHLEACQKLAQKASLKNFKPLEEAQALLTSGFEFNVGKENVTQLFEPAEEKIHVDPKKFFDILQGEHEQVMKEWERLKVALSLRNGPDARTSFTEENYQAMKGRLSENGISEVWVADHPLAGHGASDTQLYDQMDELRAEDPESYKEQMEAHKRGEREMEARVGELLGLLHQIQEHQSREIPVYSSVVPEDENPQLTLLEAQEKAEIFKRLLSTSDNLEAIRASYDEAKKLFSTAVLQAEQIKSAMDRNPALFRRMKALEAEMNTAHQQALSSLASLRKFYDETDLPPLAVADRLKDRALAESALAHAVLSEQKHKEANEKGDQAVRVFENAQDAYQSVIRDSKTLNQTVLDSKEAIKRADALDQSLSDSQHSAVLTLRQAASNHRGMTLPMIETADEFQDQAKEKLASAQRELEQKRYSEAKRLAQAAVTDFERAKKEYQAVITRCKELDRLKEKLSGLKGQMAHLRQAAQNKIDRYNGIQTLDAYSENLTSGLTTYEVAIRSMEALASGWDEVANQAKADHEAEVERQRLVREAEARRLAEAHRLQELQRAQEARHRRQQEEEAREQAAEVARGLISLASSLSSRRSDDSDSDSKGGNWGGNDDSDSKGGDW